MTLWYRRPEPQHAPGPLGIPLPSLPAPQAHPFKAWTETAYISGVLKGDDRLSDVLNARQPVRLEQATVLPIGAPRPGWQGPQEIVLDPFDLDFVLGGRLDDRSAAERSARRIHKVRYPVIVEGRNFEVRGMLHIFAGNAPEFAMHHTGALFLPVTNATVRRERRLVSDPHTDVVLVNRYAVSAIKQLDSLN